MNTLHTVVKRSLKIVLMISAGFSLLAMTQYCRKHTAGDLSGKSFTGYDLMVGYADPATPDHTWYHKTTLVFTNDSVSIAQSPVMIKGSDTTYSSSDGGFFSYKGVWHEGDSVLINAVEKSCDYCGERFRKDKNGILRRVYRKKEYKGYRTSKGLILNGIEFK